MAKGHRTYTRRQRGEVAELLIQAGLDALRSEADLDAVLRQVGFGLVRLSDGKYDGPVEALRPGSIADLFKGEGTMAASVAEWVDFTFPLPEPHNKKRAEVAVAS